MKPRIILLLVFGSYLHLLNAQDIPANNNETESSKYAYSFRFEVSTSQAGNISQYNNNLGGFATGLQFIRNQNKNLSIVTGIDYLRRGGSGQVNFHNVYNDIVGGYTQNLYLHYLSIPLMARFESNGNKMRFVGGMGMYYALLLDAWVNPQDAALSHDITRRFYRNDFGLIGMAGIAWHINKQDKLNLLLRYQPGLLNMSDQTTSLGGQNNSYGIEIGIIHNLQF